MKKKIRYFIAAAAVLSVTALPLTGCGDTDEGGSGGSNYWNSDNNTNNDTFSTNVNIDYSDFDSTVTWNDSACKISLNGDRASVDGSGASISQGNCCKISITQGGEYVISGTLNNGQIYVETGENQVHLIFNGVNITCNSSAPVYINNGKKTVITLPVGTENILTDENNDTYAVEEEDGSGEPNAALFSKKALTINGEGALSVTGHFNNGITCKDDLKIMSGTITVISQNHGIRGNDSVVIKDGTIRITAAEGDGIKSTKEEHAEKGYIYIEGGDITIDSGDDGIQAVTHLTMAGGIVTINCIKDGFHSDGNIIFSGGNVSLTAGDDGMHADKTLTISGGTIDIHESYEGLEGLEINISGGKIHLKSSDDGLNASAGKNTTNSSKGGFGFGGPGGGMSYESDCQINISGGYLYVDANGDGLDSNGDITISGGSIIVNGPTSDGDGALDSNGTIFVTGGFLVAAGSSGMAEMPDSSSTQNSIITTFTQRQQAGSIVRITDADGHDLLTFSPSKSYSSVVFSSPDIKSGISYSVYSGGSYTGGTSSDGLMANGSYSGGTTYGSVTISAILSYVGSTNNKGNPGGMGGRPGR